MISEGSNQTRSLALADRSKTSSLTLADRSKTSSLTLADRSKTRFRTAALSDRRTAGLSESCGRGGVPIATS